MALLFEKYLFVVSLLISITVSRPQPPNIVIILLDDFGWNNIGFHAATNEASNEIITPNLDALALEGIILESHYVFRFCSPTRSALLTGRNPIHVNVLNSDLAAANLSDPISGFAGIPRPMTALPEKLKSVGYETVGCGKYHVGLATPSHLPSGRGFMKSLFYLDGANTQWSDACTGWCSESGLTVDLWGQDGPAFTYNNSLSCNNTIQRPDCIYEDLVFTNFTIDAIKSHNQSNPLFLYFAPHSIHVSADGLILEVPIAQEEKFSYINNTYRRRYAAITNLIDAYIGDIIAELKAASLWDNTLLLVSADNGGLVAGNGFGGANNFPLRGGKATPFEGGIRSNAFISGGYVPQSRRGKIESSLIEVADWYTTFCSLAGVDPTDTRAALYNLPPVEGLDQWPLLSGLNSTSPRSEVIIGGDTTDGSDGATLVVGIIRSDGFKLLIGNTTGGCWQGPLSPNGTYVGDCPLDCGTTKTPLCLFNIFTDPTEHNNVVEIHTDIALELAAQIDKAQLTVFSPLRGNNMVDIACANSNKTWGGFVGPFLP
jgi:arylsulfatase B